MLSIILGWMLGRTQGVRVKGRAKPKPAPAVQMVPQQASSTATNAGAPEVVEPTVSANELSDSASGTVVEIARSPKIRHVAVPKHSDSGQAIAATPAESSPGSLVVFEDEKSASQPTQLSQDLSQESKAVGNAAAMANLKGVAHLSADEAEANLLLRIEPDYPEKARQQKIQGSVVLDIIVGNDGKVHGISTISGDPQLALAAAHAVQQWRFKPWLRNGKPSPFESRITLNFSLH